MRRGLAAPDDRSIRARLSAFDTTMIVVSLVVGIGIFRTPALVAASTGARGWFLGAWVLGGLVSLAGAFTFAEIGSRLPRAGGYYRAVAECYHPRLAFMLNWSQVLMQGAGAAGVAFIGAEYLSRLMSVSSGPSPRRVQFLACAMLAVLLVLNWTGIKTGARTLNVLTLLKIAMLVGLAVVAFAGPGPSAAPPEGPPPPSHPVSLIATLVAVFYTYGGYQNVMNFGADIRDPRRKLPLAVGAGMLIVVAVYLLINAAYVHVLGTEGVARASLVAAEVARLRLGAAGEAAVSLAIFLSAAGFVNATILQIPRSYYAMAEDRLLPAAFARVHPGTEVQRVALVFFGATMLLPALFLGSFEKLLAYVMFSDALMVVAVASTVFVLRRRGFGDDDGRVVRMPGYPFLPATFMAVLLAVAVHVLVTETNVALAGAAVIALGWPLASVLRRISGAASRPPTPVP